jgi:hypothetical protein
MQITKKEIEFIKQDIKEKGILLNDLSDSLVDHLCCSIENDAGNNFHQAYASALDSFGADGLLKIQQETILLLTIKKETAMKKTMYLLGYVAAFFITTGLLFKMQSWTGANIFLTSGIVLLNFGFLPMYFYDKYKNAIN